MQQTIIQTGRVNMGKFVSKTRSVEMVLSAGDLFKFEGDHRHTQVSCLQGTLWITQPGDVEDHILSAGQSFIISSAGPVIIQGQPEGRFELVPPMPGLN